MADHGTKHRSADRDLKFAQRPCQENDVVALFAQFSPQELLVLVVALGDLGADRFFLLEKLVESSIHALRERQGEIRVGFPAQRRGLGALQDLREVIHAAPADVVIVTVELLQKVLRLMLALDPHGRTDAQKRDDENDRTGDDEELRDEASRRRRHGGQADVRPGCVIRGSGIHEIESRRADRAERTFL